MVNLTIASAHEILENQARPRHNRAPTLTRALKPVPAAVAITSPRPRQRRQAPKHAIEHGPQQRRRRHDDNDAVLGRRPYHDPRHGVAEVAKVDVRQAQQADDGEHHGDYADAENSQQRPLVARLDLQTEDHGQGQREHQDVDEHVDHGHGCVAREAVAAGAAGGGGVPVLGHGAADEEADQNGHDEPAGLEGDDDPGDDLEVGG